METIDLILRATTEFYEQLRKDENGRYRSWEYCYAAFAEARGNINADVDYLSLQLAFYLASWGMYRGSSFLLQKDYQVHSPIVKELLKSEYDELFGMECSKVNDIRIQGLLDNLTSKIRKYYLGVRRTCAEREIKSGISDVLVTKILMGTLGCVPAYDRYFIDGVKKQGVATGVYNKRSLQKLAEFYENYYDKLEATRHNLKIGEITYPQMKLLDMGFWQIGFDADKDKGFQEAH